MENNISMQFAANEARISQIECGLCQLGGPQYIDPRISILSRQLEDAGPTHRERL